MLVLVGRVQHPTSLCTVSSRSRLDHFYVSDLHISFKDPLEITFYIGCGLCMFSLDGRNGARTALVSSLRRSTSHLSFDRSSVCILIITLLALGQKVRLFRMRLPYRSGLRPIVRLLMLLYALYDN